jgi:hypothetical protein
VADPTRPHRPTPPAPTPARRYDARDAGRECGSAYGAAVELTVSLAAVRAMAASFATRLCPESERTRFAVAFVGAAVAAIRARAGQR